MGDGGRMTGDHTRIEPTDEDGLRDLVGRLADDARGYAKAEVAVVRETMAVRARDARGGMLLVIVGISLVVAASVALVLGMLLTVAQATGPLLATLIVVGVTLIVAALLGWFGWGKVKAAFKGEL